ncbi:hypothetical protein V8E55_008706 [Tylopilus felleus]
MQNDPDKKWSKVVLPCILLWYGDQANVWSIKEADLEDVIVNVVCYVYPSLVGDESNLVQMQHGGCIYDLAVQRLSRWQHVIGNAAGHLVLKHLNEEAPIQGLTKEQLASHLLEDRRFAYKGFDIESMAFQSSLLLLLLGSTHLHDTAGWVEVPEMDLLAKCDHGIKGVLALCTAALERALTLVQEGRLDTVVDEEAQAAAVAGQEQPLSLNQATGKLSTKGSAFSHQNWGGHTTSYYKSIATRDADALGDIVAKALIHLATHRDDDAPFATLISPNGLDDPRANMCRHLLII